MEQTLTQSQMALAFNEWMRRYIEEPERFAREFQEVEKFVVQDSGGHTPAYGLECSAYLMQISRELESEAVRKELLRLKREQADIRQKLSGDSV